MAPTKHSTLTLAGENKTISFLLEPDASARSALANDLEILNVRKLRFQGEVSPEGRTDWRLNGKLGATVTQACVVTLEPVTTRIDTPVQRRFLTDMPDVSDSSEVEMPEDDSIEPLADEIDLEKIMIEALALSLPDFPRADGVDPVDISVTEPGKTPMTDEDAKPFAGLSGLRDKLNSNDENNA